MSETKISELKSHLSSYLGRVRHGESILIYDRRTPIARMVPVESASRLNIREAKRNPALLKKRKSPVQLKKTIDIDAILRESRDQR